MLPNFHITLGAIFSYVLFLLFPQIGVSGFLLIFFSSFLIDIDHYLYYVFRKKNLHPIKAVKWSLKNRKIFLSHHPEKRKEFYTGLYFLHGIEILIVLVLLIFVSDLFLYILIGFSFHLLLDVLEGLKKKYRLEKVSVINDFLKSKKLKHVGDVK